MQQPILRKGSKKYPRGPPDAFSSNPKNRQLTPSSLRWTPLKTTHMLMNYLIRAMVGVVCLLSTLPAQSVEEAPSYARHALHLSGHSLLITVGAHLSYERNLYYQPDSWLAAGNLQLTTGLSDIILPVGNDLNSSSYLSYVALTGAGSHHLEANLGGGVNFEIDQSQESIDNLGFAPVAALGYRFQDLADEGSFIFRIGAGFPDGAYVSLGWAF